MRRQGLWAGCPQPAETWQSRPGSGWIASSGKMPLPPSMKAERKWKRLLAACPPWMSGRMPLPLCPQDHEGMAFMTPREGTRPTTWKGTGKRPLLGPRPSPGAPFMPSPRPAAAGDGRGPRTSPHEAEGFASCNRWLSEATPPGHPSSMNPHPGRGASPRCITPQKVMHNKTGPLALSARVRARGVFAGIHRQAFRTSPGPEPSVLCGPNHVPRHARHAEPTSCGR